MKAFYKRQIVEVAEPNKWLRWARHQGIKPTFPSIQKYVNKYYPWAYCKIRLSFASTKDVRWSELNFSLEESVPILFKR